MNQVVQIRVYSGRKVEYAGPNSKSYNNDNSSRTVLEGTTDSWIEALVRELDGIGIVDSIS